MTRVIVSHICRLVSNALVARDSSAHEGLGCWFCKPLNARRCGVAVEWFGGSVITIAYHEEPPIHPTKSPKPPAHRPNPPMNHRPARPMKG